MPEVAELDNSPALPAIEGSAAAAILLMLLDESEAATILKQLDPDEVRQLAKAMFDTANASEQQIGQALDRFVTRSRDVSAAPRRSKCCAGWTSMRSAACSPANIRRSAR